MFERFDLWFGSGWIGFASLLITALCVFFSLSVHEFAHGFVAYKMGDNTAKYMGRLNINPMSHLDPIGALCLFLFGFGWAKPVPVNPRNFKSGRYKSGMMLTSLAGPVSNLIVAFFSFLAYAILLKVMDGANSVSPIGERLFTVGYLLLTTMFSMNIGLAVFNLIPIPPLDGSKILNAILPARIYFRIMQYEQYGFILLIILINTPLFSRLLNGLAGIIVNGFEFLIELIPFL